MAEPEKARDDTVGATVPSDTSRREYRRFKCLNCEQQLYLLGRVGDDDDWRLVRGGPEMHFEGNVAYMVCPGCGAKNGFTERATGTGRGYRLTHLIA